MQDGFLETSNTSWPGTPLYWISTAYTLAEYIEILHTNPRHSKFEVCEVPYFYINYYLRNKKVVHYLLAITTHYTFFCTTWYWGFENTVLQTFQNMLWLQSNEEKIFMFVGFFPPHVSEIHKKLTHEINTVSILCEIQNMRLSLQLLSEAWS